MNNYADEPKRGFYFASEGFNKMRRWSFTISLNKEDVLYALNGYDNSATHKGHKIEFFVTLFKRTFAIGYLAIEECE